MVTAHKEPNLSYYFQCMTFSQDKKINLCTQYAMIIETLQGQNC